MLDTTMTPEAIGAIPKQYFVYPAFIKSRL